jgi:NAD(P)-dependent dehydrogenase (short-subunit alcohol dehydrogenase family)
MRLDGQVIIVTGSAQGIGAQYARAVVEEGARVAVADINLDKAKATAAELGDAARAFHVDVTSEESCAALAAAVAGEFGGIDGLVNNAAIFYGIKMMPLMTVPIDYWNKIMLTNMTSVLICTRAVVPYLKQRGKGKIVNQSSTAAYSMGNHYTVSKRGVTHLTGGLAVELGPFNINVNAIAPGAIETEALLEHGAENLAFMADNLQVFRRPATPKDLTGTLVFLLSSDSDWITGQTIVVDGGTLLNPVGLAISAARARELEMRGQQ